MSATGFSRSGLMAWDPYYHSRHIQGFIPNSRISADISGYLGGAWRHHPHILVKDALRGGSLATAVGHGNFATRNFRQKPIVGLIKAEHKRVPAKAKGSVVAIPTVSQRRTKNILLTNSKAMPYRRKSSYKKRSRPRRRRIHKRKLPPLAIPRSKVVRFRYLANGTLNAASGAISVTSLKANSLDDPSQILSTAVPLSLDQWAAHYQKYIVLGSKVTLRFSQTANTGPGIVGIHLDDDSTALTNYSHYRELPLTKTKMLTTQKDYATIVMKYSGKRFWRLSNIKDDSEQEASFSTTPQSPADVAYFHIFAQDMVGSSNFTVDFMVEQEFICYLTEPVTLAQSSL